MFSDNVAQYPTIAVSDGKKKRKKSLLVANWLGADNIGPNPPALCSMKPSSRTDITIMNGAE